MQKKNIAIAAAAGLVIAGAAFYGGTLYGARNNGLVQEGNKSFTVGQPGQMQRQGQKQGTIPNPGKEREAGGFVAGEIISKDDKSVTVKTRDGGSKIIYFSSSTSIGKSVTGSSSDFAQAQQITASGKSNSDGSLTAEDIQIRAAQ